MKKIFILSFELFSFLFIGFFMGKFLEKHFSFQGWAIVFCLFVFYILWFLKLYKSFR